MHGAQTNHNVHGNQTTNHNYVGARREPDFVSSLGAVPVVKSVEAPVIPRDDVFMGIDAAFQSGQHRYVLHGPKGVGKSTSAYQYAQSWGQCGRPWMRTGGSTERCHVRWFSAGNALQLRAEYVAFAEQCFDSSEIFQGRPLGEIQPKVDKFLINTPNVLLVFDGVDDRESHDTVEQIVSNLLALQSGGVFVLVTTVHASMYPTLHPSCRTMLDAFTDQQVHHYLTEAWGSTWSDVAISDLRQRPEFQRLVNRHPKRLHWLSAVVRNSPTMTADGLIDTLQRAADRPGKPDAVFTVVVDALIEY